MYNAGCSFLLIEPETMRERECRWKHSPRMLSCSLEGSCFVSLPLTFLAVCDVRVEGSRVLRGCRLVSRAKIKSSRHECRESHLHHLVLCNFARESRQTHHSARVYRWHKGVFTSEREHERGMRK